MKKIFLPLIILLVSLFSLGFGLFFLQDTDNIGLKGSVYSFLGITTVADQSNDPKYAVTRLYDDYITFQGKQEDTREMATKVANFSAWLSGRGTPFLFIQAPHKVPLDMENLPNGYPNYVAQNTADFLSVLKENNVNILDLRQDIKGKEYFFKTDHHWTPLAGLTAAGISAKHLNENFGFNIDLSLFNREQYESQTFEKVFLGSQGKKVGENFVPIDDFTVFLPKFDTELSRIVPIMGIEKSGSFEACYSDYSLFEEKDIYKANPYIFYTSDYNLEIINNKKVLDNSKVLLIRDSFGCVMSPFLSLGFGQTQVVDLRFFKENIYDYIEKNPFDIVLFESNPGYNSTQFLGLK